MISMKALGVNWNKMDPFVRYGPTDFPILAPAVPPLIAPVAPPIVAPSVYNYPVITETPAVVAPVYGIPNWVLVGGAILAGVALTTLLMRK